MTWRLVLWLYKNGNGEGYSLTVSIALFGRKSKTIGAIVGRNAIYLLLLLILAVALVTYLLAEYADRWREGIVIDCGIVGDAGAPFHTIPCPQE